MSRRCCRDTVAMKVIASDDVETKGNVIPCRWCDGYGRYDGERWIFADEDTEAKRHEVMADLWTSETRQARINEVLHGKPKAVKA